MTFGKLLNSLPVRFTRIDDTNSEDHSEYRDGETWIFIREKTSRRDYSFSDTNNLVSNLKKPVNSSAAILGYKNHAIATCAAALREALNDKWLNFGTLVPIPPSKSPLDPLYDNRMERVCRQIRPDNIDVRNLVIQNQSMQASHERPSGSRISVEDLVDSYSIDENRSDPQPTHIGIVDDMLTVGTHYRAMETVLSERFPEAHLFGVFIARRIFPDENGF